MKGDMSGGACVIAAMMAIARLKPKINVTALVPATENMPGGNATKPGDVLRAMNGKTIEVINTDAEGPPHPRRRALATPCKLDLSPIVDVATLTGAMSIALGNVAYGIFANNDALASRIQAAAARRGREVLAVADVRRVQGEHQEQRRRHQEQRRRAAPAPSPPPSSSSEFVDDRPWAHLDIAGVDFFEKDKGVLVKGASGIPVRTLVNLALDLAAKPLG